MVSTPACQLSKLKALSTEGKLRILFIYYAKILCRNDLWGTIRKNTNQRSSIMWIILLSIIESRSTIENKKNSKP